MDAAALAFLLFVAFGQKSEDSQTPPPQTNTAPPAGGNPVKDAIDTGKAIIGGASTLVGVLGGLGSAAGGGTAVAGGGAAAGGAVTGGTVSGGAISGGTGTGVTGTVVTTTGSIGIGGGTAATTLGFGLPLATSAGLASAIGGGVILAAVIAILAATLVAKGQGDAKSWEAAWLFTQANARDLCRIEWELFQSMMTGRSFTTVSLRDERLDRVNFGTNIKMQGWRNKASWIPTPDLNPATILNWCRAMAELILQERATFGQKVGKFWNIPVGAQDATSSYGRYSMYGDLGGLRNVPDPGGLTQHPRGDSQSMPADRYESLAKDRVTGGTSIVPDESVLTPLDRKWAKLMALLDVMRILKMDPRIGIDAGGGRWYNTNFRDALGLSQSDAPGETHVIYGEVLVLNPDVFGGGLYDDPNRGTPNQQNAFGIVGPYGIGGDGKVRISPINALKGAKSVFFPLRLGPPGIYA